MKPWRARRVRIASSVGWVSEPLGYALYPLASRCHVSRRPSASRSGLGAGESTARKPRYALQHVGGRREPLGRGQSRKQAVHRGLAGVQGLAVGAVDVLEPRGLGARRAERLCRRVRRQAEQVRGGGRRAQVPGGAGDVPARLVVLRSRREPDPGLRLEPGDERGQRPGAADRCPLGRSEHHRPHRRRTVHGRAAGVERVVVVLDVRGEPVHQSRERRRGPFAATDERGGPGADAPGHPHQRTGSRRGGARGCARQPVDERTTGLVHHLFRQVLVSQSRRERRQRPGLVHLFPLLSVFRHREASPSWSTSFFNDACC